MRNVLVTFLLALSLLSTTWFAAVSYCQHESGLAAQHFGHHAHQHKASDDKGSTLDFLSAGAADPDCGMCHIGFAFMLPKVFSMSIFLGISTGAFDYKSPVTFPPVERAERPKWSILA